MSERQRIGGWITLDASGRGAVVGASWGWFSEHGRIRGIRADAIIMDDPLAKLSPDALDAACWLSNPASGRRAAPRRRTPTELAELGGKPIGRDAVPWPEEL